MGSVTSALQQSKREAVQCQARKTSHHGQTGATVNEVTILRMALPAAPCDSAAQAAPVLRLHEDELSGLVASLGPANLHIVSAIGKTRRGKSTLLNHMLCCDSDACAFLARGGAHPCTQGVNAAARLYAPAELLGADSQRVGSEDGAQGRRSTGVTQGRNRNLLFFDVEGRGDKQAEYEKRLLMWAVPLSSVIIYCCTNAGKHDMLKELHELMTWAIKLHGTAPSSGSAWQLATAWLPGGTGAELEQKCMFGHLIIAVRDGTHLNGSLEEEIMGQEDEGAGGSRGEAKTRNEWRARLRRAFKSVSVILIADYRDEEAYAAGVKFIADKVRSVCTADAPHCMFGQDEHALTGENAVQWTAAVAAAVQDANVSSDDITIGHMLEAMRLAPAKKLVKEISAQVNKQCETYLSALRDAFARIQGTRAAPADDTQLQADEQLLQPILRQVATPAGEGEPEPPSPQRCASQVPTAAELHGCRSMWEVLMRCVQVSAADRQILRCLEDFVCAQGGQSEGAGAAAGAGAGLTSANLHSPSSLEVDRGLLLFLQKQSSSAAAVAVVISACQDCARSVAIKVQACVTQEAERLAEQLVHALLDAAQDTIMQNATEFKTYGRAHVQGDMLSAIADTLEAHPRADLRPDPSGPSVDELKAACTTLRQDVKTLKNQLRDHDHNLFVRDCGPLYQTVQQLLQPLRSARASRADGKVPDSDSFDEQQLYAYALCSHVNVAQLTKAILRANIEREVAQLTQDAIKSARAETEVRRQQLAADDAEILATESADRLKVLNTTLHEHNTNCAAFAAQISSKRKASSHLQDQKKRVERSMIAKAGLIHFSNQVAEQAVFWISQYLEKAAMEQETS